jgi:outer membrane immunogenic protein
VAFLQRPVCFAAYAPPGVAKKANRGFSSGMTSAMERNLVSSSRDLGHSRAAFLLRRPGGIVLFRSFGFLILAAAASVACAADLTPKAGPAEIQAPPPAEFDWNGFYAGVNVGGGVDHFGFKWDVNTPRPSGYQEGSAGITSLGPLGGLQVGFNYKLPFFPFFPIVAGIEIDDSAAGLTGQTTVNGVLRSGLPFSATFGTEVYDFGTARFRLGYPWGRFLPYVTAGFTFGIIETSYNFSTPGFASSSASTAARTGAFPHVGAFGAGIEYAIDPHFTVKTEYLYEFINARRTLFLQPDGSSVSFGTRTMYHLVRLGLNYKFDFSPPVAVKY